MDHEYQDQTWSAGDSRRASAREHDYDQDLVDVESEKEDTPFDAEHRFTRIHNEVIFDKRLKPNDLKLLNYVFSKKNPRDWQCKEDVVEREIGMGRKAYYASVRRLETLGYCVRTKRYDNSRKILVSTQLWFRTPRSNPIC